MKINLLLSALLCSLSASAFAEDYVCMDDTENVQVSISNLALVDSSRPTLKIRMLGYTNGENGEVASATASEFKGSAVVQIERESGETIRLITNPTDQKDGTAQWKRTDGSVMEDLYCTSK